MYKVKISRCIGRSSVCTLLSRSVIIALHTSDVRRTRKSQCVGRRYQVDFVDVVHSFEVFYH